MRVSPLKLSLATTAWMAITFIASAGSVTRGAEPAVFLGNAFGQCARHNDLTVKIAACKEAAKMTPYPWILEWVYREMARAQRDHGERDAAIASYARSLVARDNEAVREEMEALGPLTQ